MSGAPPSANGQVVGNRITARNIVGAAGIAVFAAATFYFADFAFNHWPQANRLCCSWRSLSAFGWATAVYSAAAVLQGLIWFILLRMTGISLPPRVALAITMVSQFAKYLPGNVGPYIGRLALARRYGVDIPRGLMSLVLETIISLAVAGGFAVMAVILWNPSWLQPLNNSLWFIAGAALVFAASLMFGIWAFRRWRHIRGIELPSALRDPRTTLRGLIQSTFLFLITFVAVGWVLDILFAGLYGSGESHLLWFAMIFAAAWAVAFITPGAPAGIGVREAVLVTALSPIIGPEESTGIAIALRVVTSVGDLTVFGIGLVLLRIYR